MIEEDSCEPGLCSRVKTSDCGRDFEQRRSDSTCPHVTTSFMNEVFPIPSDFGHLWAFALWRSYHLS